MPSPWPQCMPSLSNADLLQIAEQFVRPHLLIRMDLNQASNLYRKNSTRKAVPKCSPFLASLALHGPISSAGKSKTV
jgi:hypothetical protein